MKNQLLSISLLFIVSACGGGGSSSSMAEPPQNISPPAAPSEERLTLPDVQQNTLPDEILPQTAVAEMKIGINLGNTLDAPVEGEWALPAEEYYLQAFKDAGFKHVRIPVRWDNHITTESPYEIDTAFLDRVEQIVDWSLNRDLYTIINIHHDDWYKNDDNSVSNHNRFDTIWLTIAERFKNKPAKLIFEIFNEPHGMSVAELNKVNKRVLEIIRNQTANRLVVFAGNDYSNIDTLLAIDVPDAQDSYLIGNFHSYDPWNFAGICIENWQTETDRDNLEMIYQKAADWSAANNIPVMVNEFGSAKYDFTQPENICEQSQREAYIRAHVELAHEFGVAGTFWDDGGSFSTYDRANNTWGPEKDILVTLQ